MTHTITLEVIPCPEDVRVIEQGLLNYNLQFAPPDGYQPPTIFLRDADQTLVGGLPGETYWGWLHISILWLDGHRLLPPQTKPDPLHHVRV